MNLETKVGFFVLAGLVIFGFGIMKLSDLSMKKSYKLNFVFDDIGNLRDKSAVKMSGVEVGKVRGIKLENGRAKVTAHIDADVPVYANGKVKLSVTGLIGSQFLDLNPGTPEAARLKDGDTLYGKPLKTLDQLIEKISEIVEGKDGKSGIGGDLGASMANIRSITSSLNYAIGLQREELKQMVLNFHDMSADLKGIARDFHEVTSARKADIDAAIVHMKSILERVDDLTAKIQKGEGSIGKLLADKEMGEEVKKTVSNIKETSESAKEVLARFVKVRAYWELQGRYVPSAGVFRGDGGIRLQPRDNKYYYIGGNNLGDRKYEFKDENDYEKKNGITAVLGKIFGPISVELGAIRSSAGVGLRYYPFKPLRDHENAVKKFASGLELNTQAYDFGRDEIRGRAGRERTFDKPQYDVGARLKVNRFMDIGLSVEDLAILKQYNMNTHFVFEDKDLSYLFGFISFAR